MTDKRKDEMPQDKTAANRSNKMDKVYTTLKQIRDKSPCTDGYKKLCKNLGADYGENTPLTFKQIYDSNGYNDTLWCLKTTDAKYFPLWRHFAVDCAEQVKHLMTDKRSLNALDVARLHADGKATDGELDAARVSARDAARDAAGDAARVAAGAAAGDAARVAAWVAARVAAWDAQMELLFQYCKTGKRVKQKAKKAA